MKSCLHNRIERYCVREMKRKRDYPTGEEEGHTVSPTDRRFIMRLPRLHAAGYIYKYINNYDIYIS